MNLSNLSLKSTSLFICILILATSQEVIGQCPANITTGGPHTITAAMSPCSDSGTSMNGTQDITIENGATLTLTVSTRYRVNGATIHVENGGTLIVNGSAGLLVMVNGGSLIVDGGSPGGSLQTTGDLNIGNPAGTNSGSIQLNGNATVGGNMNLNDLGTITGSGTVTVTGDINNNGGDDTGWTGNESCTGTCDDLPVELIKFTAEALSNSTSKLTWVTAAEINNQGFEMEKSSDGYSFNQIGYTEGNGTTNQISNYSYEDHQFTSSAYYRFKQVDYDGKFEYSPVNFLKHPLDLDVSAFPSFIDKKVNISGPENIIYNFTLLDMSGNRLMTVPSSNIESIEEHLNEMVQSLSPSVYMLKFESLSESKLIRVLKK